MRVYESMFPIIQTFVSVCIKHYSAKHVLISLMENWKKNLNNNEIIGAIFMVLSKAFDCIPHDLLIAKMEADSFS